MQQADSVAAVYAQALFEIAQESDQVNAYRETAEDLLEVWVREPGLKSVLDHPAVSLQEKLDLIKKCLGFIQEEMIMNFLGVLIEKNRIGHLSNILQVFLSVIDEMQGIQKATVISASPLDNESKEKLANTLSKRFGKNVLLDEQVDPSLIGGMKVRVGDTVFDGSTQSQLEQLAQNLKGFQVDSSIWE